MAPRDDGIGASVRRKEDARFLTGRGMYTDDINRPGQLHAYILRSPHPHADLGTIDTSKAAKAKGVVAVFTGADMAKDNVGGLPCGWAIKFKDGSPMKKPPHPPLAIGRVRYVGDQVAVVIADSREAAKDAAELIEVDYKPLGAVATTTEAIKPAAPQLWDVAPGNTCYDWELGDKGATDAAFKTAHKVAKIELINNRLIPNAMEPRAAIGDFDPASGDFTLYTTSQNPHVIRLLMGAFVLHIPESKLRVVAPDVGGGFGSKIYQYPEEVIVLHASRTLKRPVKWTARRAESFVSDSHGRDHETEMELAVDANGKVLGLRGKTVANVGAYLTLFGPVTPTYLHGTLLNGAYRFAAIYYEVTAAFTNTTAVDALRGAGRPEATYIVERMMDRMALELGEDPVEFRRKNFIQPDQFPYQTPVALLYDSGNYEGALDKALGIANYKALRDEQAAARAKGRYLGIGLSSWVEACGLAPSAIVGSLGAQAGLWESAVVRVMPSGKVEVLTGSHSHGQGHETAFAQVAADELQIPIEHVSIVHGDTSRIPFGWGTYGSRSGPVGGAALKVAAGKIRDKASRIAAHLLEAAPEDVEYVDGKFTVKGVPERFKTFGDVALMAHLAHNYPADLEPGLEASAFYDPKNWVYPFGTHVALVEVDAETGHVTLRRYIAVDDCGPAINPLIVEGQVHGGVAHGTGQALFENATYDDQAQLTSGSFLEYTMPRADDLPAFELGSTVTPSPHNPLGIKGIGEAGTIASTAAVANAVVDALRPFGITHLDMPFTAEKVWRAMRGGKVSAA